MDEETIRREALEALTDLEMQATVDGITRSGKNWCVQFAGGYGQFCDTFQNQFERDNSPRVIREKIKKHLLGQITQLRNKGRSRTSKRGFETNDDGGRDAAALLQEAVTQTTHAIGEAIDRTLGLATATVKSAADVTQTVADRTTERLNTSSSAPHAAEHGRSRPKDVKNSGPSEKESLKTVRAVSGKKSRPTKKAASKKEGAATKSRARGKKSSARKKSSRRR